MPANAKRKESLVFDQEALDSARMTKVHESIVTANVAFGTGVIFRAGGAFDASQVTLIVRKGMKDKDKIAPFGPAIGGIPRNKMFGKRKADKDSLGQLYKYVGNSNGECYTQQSLPLCHVLSEFVKGTYKLVNPLTGVTASYVKPENQSIDEHRKALLECIEYLRTTKQLCVQLDNVPEEYEPLKKLGHVYRFNLQAGTQSADPDALLKATSEEVQGLLGTLLPDLKENLTDHYVEEYAESIKEAAADHYEKLEIYAKKVKVNGVEMNVRISSDEDRLANTIDKTSESGKKFLELMPDGDEFVDAYSAEVGEFGRAVLSNEILDLEVQIAKLKEWEATGKGNVVLRRALETIHEEFSTATGKNLASLTALIANAGCATKREFFWQVYTNILLNKNSPYYFYLVQHGNENYNPGDPSDIDRVIIQDKVTGKAVLITSEDMLVECLLSDQYKNHGMYLNPRWIFDEKAQVEETKESTSSYKPKGHLWGAVVLQQMNAQHAIEVEVLSSFYQYLQQLKKSITHVNPFLQLHVHDHVPHFASFEAIRNKHLILKECDSVLKANTTIEALLVKVSLQIVQKFKADMGIAMQRLQVAETTFDVSRVAVTFDLIKRKIAQMKPLLAHPNYRTMHKALAVYLRQIEKNLLQFANHEHVKNSLRTSYNEKAVNYIQDSLSLIQTSIKTLIPLREETEGEGEKIKEKHDETDVIVLREKHEDAEGEGAKVKLSYGAVH